MNQNPILQGIALSNNAGALETLVHACATVDPEQKDPAVTNMLVGLNESLTRCKAELNALVNLYGGRHAG